MDLKNKTISVIVPAYNEEKTIESVVKALLLSKYFKEIICINDGSKDKTLDILKGFKNKIILVDLKENKGKGYAMVEGIKKTNSELIMFLDADFTNLSNIHIETLLKPILEENYRIVMGYLLNPYNENTKNLASELTGQRVYYREDLLPYLEKMSTVRFGIEVLLNDIFKNIPTKKLPLKNLRGLYKYEKFNSKEALKEYIKEVVEIAKVIGKKNGLIKEDYQILTNISNSKDLDDLEVKSKNIKNTKLKEFFDRYLIKYLQIGKHNNKEENIT